jgi:hypothetical protein
LLRARGVKILSPAFGLFDYIDFAPGASGNPLIFGLLEALVLFFFKDGTC